MSIDLSICFIIYITTLTNVKYREKINIVNTYCIFQNTNLHRIKQLTLFLYYIFRNQNRNFA